MRYFTPYNCQLFVIWNPYLYTRMEDAKLQLKELRMALNYCHLNDEEILEDYRDYLRKCKNKSKDWNGSDRRIYYLDRWSSSLQQWSGAERRT